jgi:hypothetical protein
VIRYLQNSRKSNALKIDKLARDWWLMPVILATWEAEIRRITVGGQPRLIIRGTPSPK